MLPFLFLYKSAAREESWEKLWIDLPFMDSVDDEPLDIQPRLPQLRMFWPIELRHRWLNYF